MIQFCLWFCLCMNDSAAVVTHLRVHYEARSLVNPCTGVIADRPI